MTIVEEPPAPGASRAPPALTPFHVAATGHSLNYLPEYLAERRGFFREQGLRVTAAVPEPWDRVLDDVAAGGVAQAALGGIWVPAMYHGRGRQYTAFAQLANRCPLAVVGRVENSSSGSLSFRDVAGKTVLLKSGNGASVGLFFKMLLREHGVDPAAVRFVQDLSGPMLASLFRGGLGDYLVVDVVTAHVLAAREPGLAVVLSMAEAGGDIPWSVYYCDTPSITPAVADTHRRFRAALDRAAAWLQAHGAEECRADLAALFPAAPLDLLVALTDAYRRHGMWASSTVSPHGFARWQQGLVDGALLARPLAYDALMGGGSQGETEEDAIEASP